MAVQLMVLPNESPFNIIQFNIRGNKAIPVFYLQKYNTCILILNARIYFFNTSMYVHNFKEA